MAIDYSMVLNQRPFSQRLSEGLTGFAQMQEFEAGAQKRQADAAAAAQRAAVLGQLPGIIDNPQAISELVLRNPAAAGDVESLLKSRQGILDNASQEAYSAALGPAMQAFDQGDRGPLDELMTKFPKQREDALKQMGLANKEQAEATGLLGLQLKMAAERGDAGAVNALLSSNANIIQRIGADPVALAEAYAKNPESFIQQADNFAAFSLGPEKYNEYQKGAAEAGVARKKAGLELSKLEAEIAKMKTTGGMDPKDYFEISQKLRKEFETETNAYQDIRSSYSRIQALGNPTTEEEKGASDLGIIYGYMKMLDPGSVVREGEFATAESAGGAWNKVGNIYNKVLTGGRLTDSQRKVFVNNARKLYESEQKRYDEVKKGVTRIGAKYKIPESDLFYEGGAQEVDY